MTPAEALTKAVDRTLTYPVIGAKSLMTGPEAAIAILAALPDGWVLMDAEGSAIRLVPTVVEQLCTSADGGHKVFCRLFDGKYIDHEAEARRLLGLSPITE